ncbi:hypothetical protein ABZ858_00475 [Streptomyces sp. NPDC047017]|uniref:hypothetical protein n=1 Tax=Streptomyces sp. NPDC047017 TaxID=3155024 RepID=UPI0033F0F3EA
MLITDAAVQETATTLVQSLGHEWNLDLEAPSDGAAHLIHSDGRAISFRPVFGGAAVQLWITGNAAPDCAADATAAERLAREAQLSVRLPEGHRYNKATTLVTDEDEEPSAIILRTLEDHLLPAFQYKPCYVGHQPWKALFDNALAAVAAEGSAPTQSDHEETEAASGAAPGRNEEVEPPSTEPGSETASEMATDLGACESEAEAEKPAEQHEEPEPEMTMQAEAEPDPVSEQAVAPEPDAARGDQAEAVVSEPQPEETESGPVAEPAVEPAEQEATPEAASTKRTSRRGGASTPRPPRKRASKRRSGNSTA